ncbi:MAG: polyphosphate polymerase domain-containing protein [Oscillospiraceae bacterium]|nr:polyphosphate polymerase domain-containing protein [Oscillospiraceae bacterium]
MQYRNEQKFILSNHTAELLRRRISAVMKPDNHSDGIYVVNNLYLDDQYDTFYQEKQIGAFSRDKYRVRYYNSDLSFIRFENKHKDGNLSYKKTLAMSKEELDCLRLGDFDFAAVSEQPLWQKVSAIHRARRLRVSAVFSYTREAYVYEAGDVRITFDSAIYPEQLTPQPCANAPLALNPVMEVKYTGFMPSVISAMLHGMPLVRTELSKYCYIRERGFRH